MKHSTRDTKESKSKLLNTEKEKAYLIDAQIAKEFLYELNLLEHGCRCGGACKKEGHRHKDKECNHQTHKN